MAKAGETDPRWIVEERADASNVNNWHWYERDVLPWSKNKLDFLLVNKSHSESKYLWSITAVTTDGISTVSMRKGKIKQLFDLELTITFSGEVIDSSNKQLIEGKINVPEFSWDSDSDNIEFTVSITSDNKDSNFVQIIKNSTKKILAQAYLEYKTLLDQECTHGLKLPTINSTNQNNNSTANSAVSMDKTTVDLFHSQKSSPNVGVKFPVSNTGTAIQVKLTENINAAPIQVYEMFISSEKIMVATNAPAYIDGNIDGKFSYIDGTITGIFTKLDKGKLIEMKWRLRSWPENHFAIGKFTFTSKNGNDCKLSIIHENVPAHDLERVECGWTRMFLSPIKSIFA